MTSRPSDSLSYREINKSTFTNDSVTCKLHVFIYTGLLFEIVLHLISGRSIKIIAVAHTKSDQLEQL